MQGDHLSVENWGMPENLTAVSGEVRKLTKSWGNVEMLSGKLLVVKLTVNVISYFLLCTALHMYTAVFHFCTA